MSNTEKEVSNIEDLKTELQKEGQVVEAINVLFLDVSSSCVGYSICSINFNTRSAKMTKAGCLWLDPNWSHPDKYSYMFHTIVNYFWIVEQIDYIVVEQYSINPKKMVGVAVVPEMMGVIKCAANENGIKVASILPQSWRSILGIKPNVTLNSKGKKERDYKQPTKEYVENLINVPAQVKSNITHNHRNTPSDLYDAVAIGLAWTERLGFKSIDTSEVGINTHMGHSIGE